MLWGPASCASAPRVVYAQSCFSVPLWAGRCWLPAPSLAAVCERLRIRLPEPIGFATQRISPAYYVELRALDIAKDEAELSTFPIRRHPPIRPIARLWPFRWPPPVATEPVVQSPSAPVTASKQDLNLLI